MKSIRFKYCYSNEKGKLPKKLFEVDGLGKQPYLTMDCIRTGKPDFYASEGLFVSKNSTCLLWDGANAGEIFVSPIDGILSSTCAILQSNSKIHDRMSFWYAKYCEFILRDNTNGMGVPHVDGEFLANIKLPIHNLEKQKNIGEYLDKKCRLIDELISQEKSAILELEKYKDQLIFDLTSTGETNKIKYIFDYIGSGSTPDSNNSSYYDGDINWIQSGDLYKKSIISEVKSKITIRGFKSSPSLRLLKPPFIVIAMYGASIGNIAISQIDACSNQACCSLSYIDKKYNLSYVYYCLYAGKQRMLKMAEGGTQPNINKQIIQNFVIKAPSLLEQNRIASFLNDKCCKIGDLIKTKETKIELLELYKKSLIYECVTGKKEAPYAN